AALASSAYPDRHRARTAHRALPPMTWRRVPPVMSPIAPTMLVRAFAAAVGVRRVDREALERQLASTYQAQAALVTDSGTSALVLALRAAVADNATVAMPGYGCIDLIAAA